MLGNRVFTRVATEASRVVIGPHASEIVPISDFMFAASAHSANHIQTQYKKYKQNDIQETLKLKMNNHLDPLEW